MEHQCKIGGESLRNGNAVNEDRISKLPQDLLVKILSSVPAENVIATSVLSKRWRSLWMLVPNLKFDSDDTGSESVYRTLILNKAPFLERLHLTIGDEWDEVEIAVLIGMAFARNVRKLVLNLFWKEDEPVTFPTVIFSCNDTLEMLKLDGYILLDFPLRVCLKSLRKLHLHYVEFEDEESVCNLLCGCPSLQDLFVLRRSLIELTTFTIAVPSLQRLTIEESSHGVGGGGYVINAPSLKYLNIEGFVGLDNCLIEHAPELLEAKVQRAYNITNENIVASLTSAKRLTLSSIEIKFPTASIFYQLVSLELSTEYEMWLNLVSFMLASSPKLQIRSSSSTKNEFPVSQRWIQPKCVPECLLFHLETLVWKKYEWPREDEKEVATYILKNARRLKKATLSTKPIKSTELEKLEKRREMLNELASVVPASVSCHLECDGVSDAYSSCQLVCESK